MKRPGRTARVGSKGNAGLRALATAAAALKDARPAFREEMRRRGARALDGLGLSSADLGRAFAVDPKRAARFRDPGPEGLSAPWWALATLPPNAFRGAIAALQELHIALHGEGECLSREQHCVIAMESMSATCSLSTGAMAGDMRIDAQEARTILPTALRALRRLRAYVVALGGNPDDADGDE